MVNDITMKLMEGNPLYRKWIDIMRDECKSTGEDISENLIEILDTYANGLYKEAVQATEQRDYSEAIILNTKKEEARRFIGILKTEGFDAFYNHLPKTNLLTTEDGDPVPRIYKY